MKTPVTDNPWQALRQLTAARIALGRAGISQPTAPQLAFQLAHARARDAVHLALEAQALAQALQHGLQEGLQKSPPGAAGPAQPAQSHASPDDSTSTLPLLLHSAAGERSTYLQRPDLGRRLDADSRSRLQALVRPAAPWDIVFVIADGLSALAVEQHALPFLQALAPRLAAEQWSVAPYAIVTQGRVAIGDEIGELLGAQAVVVLIGERPGLSSPDSMGLYLTWQPRCGLADAARNCISNVRPAGLQYGEAAYKLHYLLSESRRRRLSGIALKDETDAAGTLAPAPARFLL